MPHPDSDHDEHDAQYDGDIPREVVVRNGNPGVPQSAYQVDDTAPTDPAVQRGGDVSVGPTGEDDQ